jgi:hypothetical protein
MESLAIAALKVVVSTGIIIVMAAAVYAIWSV